MKYTIVMTIFRHSAKLESANDWIAWYCANAIV